MVTLPFAGRVSGSLRNIDAPLEFRNQVTAR